MQELVPGVSLTEAKGAFTHLLVCLFECAVLTCKTRLHLSAIEVVNLLCRIKQWVSWKLGGLCIEEPFPFRCVSEVLLVQEEDGSREHVLAEQR